MIHFVEGILVSKTPELAVVQCGGFGLSLLIPLSSYEKLPSEGQQVKLRTHLAVREDDLTLYAFSSESEHSIFLKLVGVSGIGPKLGLSILSGMSVRDLKTALIDGDVKRLSSISGIGKKTAERMVVELRDKFSEADITELSSGPEAGPEAMRMRDAVLALVALGYKQQDARKMIEQLPESRDVSVPIEDLVRKALAG